MPNIKVEQAKFFNEKYLCSQKAKVYLLVTYLKLELNENNYEI